MTPQKSKQLVLVSSIALIGIAVYRQKGNPGSLFKRVWGVGALALMLSVLADFAPQVAGPLAGVAVLGALTHGGDAALVNLTSGVQNTAAKVTGTAGASNKPSTPASKAAAGKGGPLTGAGSASHPATPASGGGAGGAY